MELNELKNIWKQAEYDMNQPLTVDRQFMRKLSLEKTQSSLNHLRWGAIVEIIINFVFVAPIAGYAFNHLHELKFAIPALLLVLMGVGTIAWSIYCLILLSTLHYFDSITRAQKQLTRFRYQDLFRQRTLLYILVPLSWGAILILFCKVVLHLDMYQYPGFLLMNMAASIALVPVMIWVAKKFPDKKMEETLAFLETIKKFESEAER
jgi:hypothetical protein